MMGELDSRAKPMAEIRLSNGRVKARGDGRSGWLAAGGIVGAVLASSCCVIPLVLVTLGVSGAWIGSLTALEPYEPYFVAATLALLAGGFWHVYFRNKPDCADGSYCAQPKSSIVTKSALWGGTILVALALTMRWWAPLFY
jgi:mercuric ion transport protein|nr:mercuric transporter MerT family protein [uncultured Sphingomonas sp.]